LGGGRSVVPKKGTNAEGKKKISSREREDQKRNRPLYGGRGGTRPGYGKIGRIRGDVRGERE